MSDQQHEQLPALLDSRGKAESKVKRIHQQIDEAIDNGIDAYVCRTPSYELYGRHDKSHQ